MSADATGTRAEMCKCGHARKSHIYEEGACRPGFVCQESCRQFEPVDASSNRATVCERCGSGLLDDKHIASYPPCNGEDASPNRVRTGCDCCDAGGCPDCAKGDHSHATRNSAAKCSCWADGFAGFNADPNCPVHAMPNRATVCERCGSGLLDGKHIASYPPCNGEDAIRNRVADLERLVAAGYEVTISLLPGERWNAATTTFACSAMTLDSAVEGLAQDVLGA